MCLAVSDSRLKMANTRVKNVCVCGGGGCPHFVPLRIGCLRVTIFSTRAVLHTIQLRSCDICHLRPKVFEKFVFCESEVIPQIRVVS